MRFFKCGLRNFCGATGGATGPACVFFFVRACVRACVRFFYVKEKKIENPNKTLTKPEQNPNKKIRDFLKIANSLWGNDLRQFCGNCGFGLARGLPLRMRLSLTRANSMPNPRGINFLFFIFSRGLARFLPLRLRLSLTRANSMPKSENKNFLFSGFGTIFASRQKLCHDIFFTLARFLNGHNSLFTKGL